LNFRLSDLPSLWRISDACGKGEVERNRMETIGSLRLRTHGSFGRSVIVLHGGPAAVGSAVEIAKGLSDRFRVFEPWQRGSGVEPLTVAKHVEDLHALIQTRCEPERPAIVGESWGAMLALAYAAAHPTSSAATVLVGCGTFDPIARAELRKIFAERTWSKTPYDYAPLSSPPREDLDQPFDQVAHIQTWDDIVRLQNEGAYPQAFAAIKSPVLMLHGDYDPHPGPTIRDSLKPYLPQLEYKQFERCGHSPWTERFARDDFFAALRTWLEQRLSERS
jgi:pimeloyl-ACP methyl ester carboxylesterase